jgi:uncharacterized OB-fold protein
MTEPAFRVLPDLDQPSGFFWGAGADGRLRFLRCEACSYLIHPPAPYCPRCQSSESDVVQADGAMRARYSSG